MDSFSGWNTILDTNIEGKEGEKKAIRWSTGFVWMTQGGMWLDSSSSICARSYLDRVLEELTQISLSVPRSLSTIYLLGLLQALLEIREFQDRMESLVLRALVLFTNPSARSIFKRSSTGLNQSFPSPRLVASPRLKNLVCPTIYP